METKVNYLPKPLKYGSKGQWEYIKFIENNTNEKYEGICYLDLCNFIDRWKGLAWSNYNDFMNTMGRLYNNTLYA